MVGQVDLNAVLLDQKPLGIQFYVCFSACFGHLPRFLHGRSVHLGGRADIRGTDVRWECSTSGRLSVSKLVSLQGTPTVIGGFKGRGFKETLRSIQAILGGSV